MFRYMEEEELIEIDGCSVDPVAYTKAVTAISAVAYGFGYAVGKAVYYLTH